MKIYLTRRCIVRLITFTLAILMVLTSLIIINARKTDRITVALENNYLEAIEALSSSTDNISTTLKKGIYAGSPEMLEELSSKLWHDCAIAKSALSHIPMGDTQLEKTNKFLSQVGNYSISIAETAQKGSTLTIEEYTNLSTLSEFSDELKNELWQLEQKIQSGQIKIKEVFGDLAGFESVNSGSIYEGFNSLEEGFQNYPTLIYDGPFSDHIMEKQPEMLKGSVSITKEEAHKIAAEKSGIPSDKLFFSDEESSKMPSYRFEGTLDKKENVCVSVTKQGGLISYILKSRTIDAKTITEEDASRIAGDYLKNLGINDMTTTYYEIYNNICTINFASTLGQKTVYTDLIKVSVALDNGEVTGYDARGYIVNHTDRTDKVPLKSASDAQKILSPLLSVKSSRLAIIPSKGQNEVTCYEFSCKNKNNEDILVYVNADTLAEEQILLVYKSASGVLTM